MQRVTIKAYAVKHKLSVFNVMKMIKSSKLKSETIEEDDKVVTYIILDDEIETEIKKGTQEISLEEEVKILTKEVSSLRDEIEALKKSYL